MKKLIILGVLTLLCILGFISSCTSIDSGTVGIQKHFGAIDPHILTEGINFTRPWPLTDVINVDVKVGKSEAECSASSKDLQAIHTKISIQWSVSPTLAPKVIQVFGSEDAMEKAVLEPAIQEVVKSVSAKYTAEELITERSIVKQSVEKELNDFIRKTLTEKNAVGAIKLANVAITDFDFSKEFNGSIEAKVKAQQDSLRAANEKTTRVTQAEAAAKEQTLKADATAYSLDTESKARAAAIKRESEALAASPNLVQLRIAERWDGKLPTYTGNSIPMLQIK